MSESVRFLELWYLYLTIRQLPLGKNYRRRVFECAKNSGIRFNINYEDGENDATTKVILKGFAKLNDEEILEKCYEGIFIIDNERNTEFTKIMRLFLVSLIDPVVRPHMKIFLLALASTME
jgi:hypothetical protein